LGTITTILILNYTAAPFILLSASASIYTWKLLGWYGHIVVMGGLAFFYLGGTKYLKGLQKKRGILPPSKGAVPNGVTPIEEKNFVLPPAVDSIVSPPEN
jgi:lysophospholipid acyltransferase